MAEPFTVFLPVYNEEEILVRNTEKLLEFLRSQNTPFEILIGSNGSSDRTVTLGMELKRKHREVEFFHLPRPGTGTAFRRALEVMKHDRLISLDMDLSVALDFIPESLTLLQDHDIVIGSKKLGVENRSLYRRWGSDFFIAYSKHVIGLPFDDYSIGAKAYRKTVLRRYHNVIGKGTFYVQNIIYLAHRDHLKLIQVPVHCMDNRSSRFNLIWEGIYKFWSISRLWLSLGRIPSSKTNLRDD